MNEICEYQAPAQKSYSVPGHIWRAIYPVLIYISVSSLVSGIAGGIYAFNLIMESGGSIPDMASFTEQIMQWTMEHALLFTLLGNICCLAPFIPLWIKTRNTAPLYQIEPSPIRVAAYTVAAFMGLNFIISIIIGLSGLEKYFSYEIVEQIISSGNAMVRILTIVVAAPVIEELCFRGIILNRLLSWLPLWLAVVIQALLFGIAHLNPVQGLYTFVIGLALGWLFIRYRKLWLCMAGHFAFNLPSTLGSLMDEGVSNILLGSILLPVFILCAAGIYLLLKHPAAQPVEVTQPAQPDQTSEIEL